jgi:hypothetical protein
MSAWTCRLSYGKAAAEIVPPRLRIPYWKGLGADSEEKREPASDIDAVVVDSLKVPDPKRPIREVDIPRVSLEQVASASPNFNKFGLMPFFDRIFLIRTGSFHAQE